MGDELPPRRLRAHRHARGAHLMVDESLRAALPRVTVLLGDLAAVDSRQNFVGA